MKKTITVLLAIMILSVGFANAPPEFDTIHEGVGIRVLLIDDFEGEYKDHGNKTSWALYDAYPMAEVKCLDIREAKNFAYTEEYDLIIVMPWFDTEREAKKYISKSIIESDTMKIAPAGNADTPYKHDNALGEWFVLIGANGHEDWCQGDIKWNESELEGTCGATIEFGIALIGQMIEKEMEVKHETE